MKLKKKVFNLFVPSFSSINSKAQYTTVNSCDSSSNSYQWFSPRRSNSSSLSISSFKANTQVDDISTSALSSASSHNGLNRKRRRNKENYKHKNLTEENIASFTAGGCRSRNMMYEFHKQMKNATAVQQQLKSQQDNTIKTSSPSRRYHRRKNSGISSRKTNQTTTIYSLEESLPRTQKKRQNSYIISYSRKQWQQHQQKDRHDEEGPVDVDAVSCDGSITSADEDEQHFPLCIPEINIQGDGRRRPHAAMLINI